MLSRWLHVLAGFLHLPRVPASLQSSSPAPFQPHRLSHVEPPQSAAPWVGLPGSCPAGGDLSAHREAKRFGRDQ